MDRIQPFRGDDGNIQLLLDFAKKAMPLIDIRFENGFEKNESLGESEPWAYEQMTYLYGSRNLGYQVTHRMGFEPKYGGYAEDHVTLKALGLPPNLSFEMECTRYYHNPRFIEIRLSVEDALSEKVVQMFKDEFQQSNRLSPEELKTTLQSARAGIFNRAWSGAEMQARLVLKTDPLNPEALFYLGVALAAQGDERAGEEYLTRALSHDPTNYDIYYNLGLIYMRREEYESAIALYVRGLFQSEDNHAIHYQLARAFEAAGKLEHAIEHYEKAIATSPNPSGAFHYTGMDFTEDAKKALQRLKKAD